LITLVEFQSFVQWRLVAHRTFVFFLHAAHPSRGPVQPAPGTRPAAWKLDSVGEDAGRHLLQLIAAYSGAPCGQAWIVTHAAALALELA
jgi:hypothetical protein